MTLASWSAVAIGVPRKLLKQDTYFTDEERYKESVGERERGKAVSYLHCSSVARSPECVVAPTARPPPRLAAVAVVRRRAAVRGGDPNK